MKRLLFLSFLMLGLMKNISGATYFPSFYNGTDARINVEITRKGSPWCKSKKVLLLGNSGRIDVDTRKPLCSKVKFRYKKDGTSNWKEARARNGWFAFIKLPDGSLFGNRVNYNIYNRKKAKVKFPDDREYEVSWPDNPSDALAMAYVKWMKDKKAKEGQRKYTKEMFGVK